MDLRNLKRKGIMLAAACMAAGAGVYWAVLQQKTALVVSQAPDVWDVRLPLTTGDSLVLSELLHGKTTVVHFFASWCPPCAEEMPDLLRLHKEFSPRGIQFLGVGIDSAKNILAFQGRFAIKFPTFVTGTDGLRLMENLGNKVKVLPFTLIVRPNGQVSLSKIGKISPEAVREALLEPPS